MSNNKSIDDAYAQDEVYEIIARKYTKNINVMHTSKLTTGDKIADKLASFAGSWKFIIIFFAILLAWISLNSIILITNAYDPYPFILLNLILSCLAAIQAPVIMMSQNRQEAKDRMRAEHDYEINLKAEIVVEEILSKLIHLEKEQKILITQLQNLSAHSSSSTHSTSHEQCED